MGFARDAIHSLDKRLVDVADRRISPASTSIQAGQSLAGVSGPIGRMKGRQAFPVADYSAKSMLLLKPSHKER